jgi:hypothetical protein
MEVAMTAPRGHEPAQPSIPSVGPWFVPGRRRRPWWVGLAVVTVLVAWAALGVLSIPGDKWGKKIGTDFLELNGQLSNGLWVLFAAEILVPVLVLAAGRRRGRPT